MKEVKRIRRVLNVVRTPVKCNYCKLDGTIAVALADLPEKCPFCHKAYLNKPDSPTTIIYTKERPAS
jgi:hypothetical protein